MLEIILSVKAAHLALLIVALVILGLEVVKSADYTLWGDVYDD